MEHSSDELIDAFFKKNTHKSDQELSNLIKALFQHPNVPTFPLRPSSTTSAASARKTQATPDSTSLKSSNSSKTSAISKKTTTSCSFSYQCPYQEQNVERSGRLGELQNLPEVRRRTQVLLHPHPLGQTLQDKGVRIPHPPRPRKHTTRQPLPRHLHQLAAGSAPRLPTPPHPLPPQSTRNRLQRTSLERTDRTVQPRNQQKVLNRLPLPQTALRKQQNHPPTTHQRIQL